MSEAIELAKKCGIVTKYNTEHLTIVGLEAFYEAAVQRGREEVLDAWDDLLEDLELHGMHSFEPYIVSKQKFKVMAGASLPQVNPNFHTLKPEREAESLPLLGYIKPGAIPIDPRGADTLYIVSEAIECQQCDFENALNPSRAVWLCPVCKRDLGVEYYFWAQAVHPEWFKEELK